MLLLYKCGANAMIRRTRKNDIARCTRSALPEKKKGGDGCKIGHATSNLHWKFFYSHRKTKKEICESKLYLRRRRNCPVASRSQPQFSYISISSRFYERAWLTLDQLNYRLEVKYKTATINERFTTSYLKAAVIRPVFRNFEVFVESEY